MLFNVVYPDTFNDDTCVDAELNVVIPDIFNDDTCVEALLKTDTPLTFKLLVFNVEGLVKLLIYVNNVVDVACKFDILFVKSPNLTCECKIDASIKNYILYSMMLLMMLHSNYLYLMLNLLIDYLNLMLYWLIDYLNLMLYLLIDYLNLMLYLLIMNLNY